VTGRPFRENTTLIVGKGDVSGKLDQDSGDAGTGVVLHQKQEDSEDEAQEHLQAK